MSWYVAQPNSFKMLKADLKKKFQKFFIRKFSKNSLFCIESLLVYMKSSVWCFCNFCMHDFSIWIYRHCIWESILFVPHSNDKNAIFIIFEALYSVWSVKIWFIIKLIFQWCRSNIEWIFKWALERIFERVFELSVDAIMTCFADFTYQFHFDWKESEII